MGLADPGPIWLLLWQEGCFLEQGPWLATLEGGNRRKDHGVCKGLKR